MEDNDISSSSNDNVYMGRVHKYMLRRGRSPKSRRFPASVVLRGSFHSSECVVAIEFFKIPPLHVRNIPSIY